MDEERSIVFVSNNDIPYDIRSKIVYSVNNILDEQTDSIDSTKEKATILYTKGILGTYQLENSQKCILSANSDDFYIQLNDKVEYPLYQIHEDMFYSPGLDAWLWFSKSNLNKIIVSRVSGVIEGEKIPI